MSRQDSGRREIYERRRSRQQIVGQRADTVNVAAAIDVLLSERLLWRHIERRAGDQAFLRCFVLALRCAGERLHETEVE